MITNIPLIASGASGLTDNNTLQLTTLHQAPKTTGRHGWRVVEEEVRWQSSETAIIIVDMWNKHWSWGATERVDIMAPRMNAVINTARDRGIQIIHAPSDTMDFYDGHPARAWVLDVPHIDMPEPIEHSDPPQPVDSSDGGSDTGEENSFKAWHRQHPVIEIKDGDAISDNGQEVYNILKQKGIKNLLYMGVHTNMCVLGRSFAIKAMVQSGQFNVALVRDLTDAMYNPFKPPYVSHEEGTQLIIAYIEKFWCPTITSDDLTANLPQ